jgi:hypothetical protein
MKWAGFGALVVFVAPCVGARGGGDRATVAIGGRLRRCGHYRSLVELLH